ncbi:MAG: hypothetical protein ACLFVR_16605, partial [Thiohalospira sp.]
HTEAVVNGSNLLNLPVNSSFWLGSIVDANGILDDGRFSYEGYVNEVFVFNRELSENERTQITNYLNQKWNIY